ncbi:hypothetical protein GUJ93_ZPchr0015g6630 [Zizania palustris]|uniref:Uncharacterized protein n=1 Tax=Zizania palustris TaxID=103762 RepID=A0A8J5TI10_ZIZPA|nr:hypothetical protein GUJ93_ZPchr0015g6630 [Zizania palustris]
MAPTTDGALTSLGVEAPADVEAPTIGAISGEAIPTEGATVEGGSTLAEVPSATFVPGRGKSMTRFGPLPSLTITPSSNDPSASNSEEEAAVDDRQALSWLPPLAPFLEQWTGLRMLLKPLANKGQEVTSSELVYVLSEARAPELDLALERAAL